MNHLRAYLATKKRKTCQSLSLSEFIQGNATGRGLVSYLNLTFDVSSVDEVGRRSTDEEVFGCGCCGWLIVDDFKLVIRSSCSSDES